MSASDQICDIIFAIRNYTTQKLLKRTNETNTQQIPSMHFESHRPKTQFNCCTTDSELIRIYKYSGPKWIEPMCMLILKNEKFCDVFLHSSSFLAHSILSFCPYAEQNKCYLLVLNGTKNRTHALQLGFCASGWRGVAMHVKHLLWSCHRRVCVNVWGSWIHLCRNFSHIEFNPKH